MPDLPEPIYSDAQELEAHEIERWAYEMHQRELAWLTTGWGAVGVDWCVRCGNRFDGAAYVYDHPLAGRTYTCRRCIDIVTRHSTTPQPCEICGRRFVWVGGTLNKPGLPPRPRPRRHLCSEACRRADRGDRRRTRRDTRHCAACGDPFTPTRADARYCSHRCRQRAYRARNEEAAP